MAINRVTTAIWVCIDYDRHLKIGPNRKGKRFRLLSSSSSICPEKDINLLDFNFYSKRAQLVSMRGHEEGLRPVDGGLFLIKELKMDGFLETAVAFCFKQLT